MAKNETLCLDNIVENQKAITKGREQEDKRRKKRMGEA
jgi:hypothetical protein